MTASGVMMAIPQPTGPAEQPRPLQAAFPRAASLPPEIPADIPADFADHLRCPLTQSPVRWMTRPELADLNAAALRGDAAHLDGTLVDGTIAAALVNEDHSLAYRYAEGVLMMLPISALALDKDAISRYGSAHRKEKADIQTFYDQIGWKRDEKGDFEDAVIWEDLRQVSADYLRKCHLRVNRYLKPKGNYLLDVASGPVQYQEYLTYSQGYSRRICMDISIAALREARRKVGDKGIYILGDITNLPIRTGSLDAVISLHTIYHVPQDEQSKAFEELYRALKPGRSGVIVYTFNTAPLVILGLQPKRWWTKARNSGLARGVKRLLGRKPGPPMPKRKIDSGGAPFYFHDHSLSWFKSRKWSFPLEIVVWRSVNVWFLRTYIHPQRMGKFLLSVLFFVENLFPRFTGRNGPYPMFVLRKP